MNVCLILFLYNEISYNLFFLKFIRVVKINELEQELELSFCKFLKILMVSDKTIHEAFRIHKTL